MQSEEGFLLPLAASISDGDDVDWRRAETDAAVEEERELVRCLETIAHVAQLHRTLGAAGALRAPAIHASATLAAPPRRPSEDEAAMEWGPLQLLEPIGVGASGEVFRAWDESLAREVALKLYKQAETVTRAGSIVEEGRLLARVRHPNVVTVHGAERHEGRAGIWMELIRGRSLSEIAREQGPFGAREAMLIGIDLCRATAATHKAGLIHGDIKASNVMREEGGRIVLMDFGAGAESLGQDSGGRISGTPLYMARELFLGESVSVRSDIYSLGVLLHHLVTGGFPVSGRSMAELKEAHAAGRGTMLRDERPDLPEPFLAAVERATSADPARRYESAGAFESALVQAIGFGSSPQAVAPARRRSLYAFAAIGLALASIALVVRLRTEPSPPPTSTATIVPMPKEPLAVPAVDTSSAPTGKPVTPSPRISAATRAPSALPEANVSRPTGPSAPQPAAGSSPPYTVEAAFFRSHGSGGEVLAPGAHVDLGDQLYLQFQASSSLHVYVINEDEKGAAFLLFPLPGQDLTNPLPAGTRLLLPGNQQGRPRFWQVTSDGAREHFLIVASPERLVELEAELLTLDRATAGRPLTASLIGEGAVEGQRGVGGLASGAPADPGTKPRRLSDLAHRLLARPETVQGIFVREFSLENPGS